MQVTDFVLTSEQQRAHDIVIDFVKTGNMSLLTMGGYAGTGKTSTVAEMARTLKSEGKRIAFCTVSGKASTVLKSKLAWILTDQDYCGTIHTLIYRLIGKKQLNNGRHELYFETREDLVLPYDLIVLDEASMVTEWIFQDLARLQIPILAVGDHGQLPPVKGSFNLMADPMIKLEKIMRQAEGNPIIDIALRARNDGDIPYGDYGAGCIKTRDTAVLHSHDYANLNSIMLCATNKTRVKMNSFAREKLGRIGRPLKGEPIICLFNNRRKMIFNGNIGVIDKLVDFIDETGNRTYQVSVDMGDYFFCNKIEPDQFGQEFTNVPDTKSEDLDYFDWAYCITTHKAQGSEWNNVLVIEEGQQMWKDDIWRKWLYTAVTRAKEKVIIFKR